jgi:predicted TIM-barrel fold metal-dependent hydrolase
MLIVDSQVHIWAADTPERPWPNRPALPHRPVPFSAADLLQAMDEGGVDRVVIVPPTWEGDRNDVALAAARANPERFAVMGRIDPDQPGIREQLPNWRQQPGMLGLRFHFARPEYEEPLRNRSYRWIWSLAEAYQLPVMMNVTPEQIALVEDIARAHPKLKLTLDHMVVHFGKKDEEAFCDLPKVLRLARFDNVAVKASSLPSYTCDPYPYRRLHGYVRQAYEAFGPERVFWGTDYSKIPCSYSQAVAMFVEEMDWLSNRDKDLMMGQALCAWIGWPP